MDRRKMVAQLFQDHFGGGPRLWARAPGRVDLMGSHTDYNLGYVLTLPISRDTWIAARANGRRDVRLHAANLNDSDSFSLDRLADAAAKRWTRYMQGVAFQLQAEGRPLSGFDAVIHSTVPLESGLSSSAALECATAIVFQELGGWQMEPKIMALLCQRAENEFVGVSCGILDQYSSCLGQSECALLLDCRDLSTRVVRLAGGIGVVVCNTMSPRRLSGGEYAQRRADCELGATLLGASALREVTPEMLAARRHELPGHVAKRCEFIVAESLRAESLARALEAGDRLAIRHLYDESFTGARDLFEISAPAMEAMRGAMLAAPGVIGARQAGAGFGGCLVAIVEEAETGAFADAVRRRYCEATEVNPEIYPVQAAAGANVFAREQSPQ